MSFLQKYLTKAQEAMPEMLGGRPSHSGGQTTDFDGERPPSGGGRHNGSGFQDEDMPPEPEGGYDYGGGGAQDADRSFRQADEPQSVTSANMIRMPRMGRRF